MTKTYSAAIRHIETLANHGAAITAGGESIPLTKGFYMEAVRGCRKGGINAATFEMALPGIEEAMALCVHRDGRVDSGSMKNICGILASM